MHKKIIKLSLTGHTNHYGFILERYTVLPIKAGWQYISEKNLLE